MQTVSDTWRTMFADKNHKAEYRVELGGASYGMNLIVSLDYENALFSDTLSVGNVFAGTLKLTVIPQGTIGRMAKVCPFVRLTLGSNTSEWLPQGVFYIDTRELTSEGYLSLVCYDDILKMEQTFLNPELEQGDWPITMEAAVNEICSRIDVTLDERSQIESTYLMEYPNDYTMRECMGYIAVAHGGNWIMSPRAQLRLVLLRDSFQNEDSVIDLGRGVTSFSEIGASLVVSRVTCLIDEENSVTFGDDSAYHLELDLPWATEQMAQTIYTQLAGLVYTPFEAGGAYLDPSAELGDPVSLCGIRSAICALSISCSPDFIAEIAAPGEQEVDHEYPYLGSVTRTLDRKVGLNTAYYGVSISRKEGLSIKKSDASSEALFNSDVLAMRAVIDGAMKDCIYFDTAAGKYRISGDVLVEGSLASDATVTDALYAEQGDVAQLTVDWISTSKKVMRYLNEDTSDDNYFEGHDQSILFITGAVSLDDNGVPLTEQLTNRYGAALYWAKDITGADIVDGYPYIDGQRIYTTTEETDWPLTVYQYKTQVKQQFTFELDSESGAYIPVSVYGAGDGTNQNNQARIIKTTSGFDLIFTTASGVETGVYMRNDGFVDVTQRRADLVIDTGASVITVKPEGELAAPFNIQYQENGDTLTLTWPDGGTFQVVKS